MIIPGNVTLMKLNIYLIRHSDAESISKGIKDSERKLTPEGINKIREAATIWKNFIPTFDYIISSPYVRALQTAKVIAEVFNCPEKIMTDRRIACGSRTDDVVEIANSLNAENIAFVGHQPDMSDHVSAMISSNGAFADFKKGAIAKITFHNKAREGKGILEYLIPASNIIKS